MNSNTKNITMKNGVVKSGEFTYTRQPRKLKAYGEEFEIPAKTVEFGDKLDEIKAAIGRTTKTSDTVKVMREGIALFIGEEKAEERFPEAKLDEIDVDEILGFWTALNFELNRTQNELLARYSAAKAIR